MLQQNEKIYSMLKSASPTYTMKDWDAHTENVEKIRQAINMTERRKHQQQVASKILRQKQHSMMTQTFPIKHSLTLLNSERRT